MSLDLSALFWLILAAPIIFFHLWKRPRKKVFVASLQFWEKANSAPQDSASLPQNQFAKLTPSLMRHLLILCALVLALANPFWNSFASNPINEAPQRVILLIDNSTSLAATDVSPSRFAHAKKIALNIINRLDAEDSMTIISASKHALVQQPLTDDKESLRKTIHSLAITQGTDNFEEALKLSSLIANNHSEMRIKIITDHPVTPALLEITKPLPHTHIETYLVTANSPPPAPIRNIGITQFEVRRNLTDRSGYQLFFTLFNQSEKMESLDLELSLNGKLLDLLPIEIPPHERISRTRSYQSFLGGEIEAKFHLKDHLVIDNTAKCQLSPSKKIKLTLVTQGNHSLETLFRVMQGVDLKVVSQPPTSFVKDEILVYHQIVPPKDSPLPERILFLDPREETLLFQVQKQTQEQTQEQTSNSFLPPYQIDENSPLLRGVNIELPHSVSGSGLSFTGAKRIAFTPPYQRMVSPIVSTKKGEPLLAHLQYDSQNKPARAVLMTADVNTSEVSQRVAFPILIANSLAWLTQTNDADETISQFHPPFSSNGSSNNASILSETETALALLPASPFNTNLTSTNNVPIPLRNLFLFLALLIFLIDYYMAMDRDSDGRLTLGSGFWSGQSPSLPGIVRLFFFILLIASFKNWHVYQTATTPTFSFLIPESENFDADAMKKIQAEISTFTTEHPSVGSHAVQFPKGTNLALAAQAAYANSSTRTVPNLILLSQGKTPLNGLSPFPKNVPLFLKPIKITEPAEVQISHITLPENARLKMPLLGFLQIDSNISTRATVIVYLQSNQILKKEVTIPQGGSRVPFPFEINQGTHYQISASLISIQDDTEEKNNHRTTQSTVLGKPQILIVTSEPERNRNLQNALAAQGIDSLIQPPNKLSVEITPLLSYSSVVLSNVSSTELSADQMKILELYVRQFGGGLLLIGGDRAFGFGGYSKTPLDTVSPLKSDLPDLKKRLSLILAIDKSGSMRGEKLRLAKQACQATIEKMKPDDQLAIFAFDTQVTPIRELKKAGKEVTQKSTLAKNWNRISASGGTDLKPLLQTIEASLSNSSLSNSSKKQHASQKGNQQKRSQHVILLTDGHNSSGNILPLVQKLALQGVTISVVSIGKEADQKQLKKIALSGNGRFYHSENSQAIPQYFVQDALAANRELKIDEPFFATRTKLKKRFANIPFDQSPLLSAAVKTRADKMAEVILQTETGEPLLAWWQHGLGVTAAFASDAGGEWSSQWTSWDQYGLFWSQVIRKTMKPPRSANHQLTVTTDGNQLTVTLEALTKTGAFLNRANTSIQLRSPQVNFKNENEKWTSIKQVAPGIYQQKWNQLSDGAYQVWVQQKQDDTVIFQEQKHVTIKVAPASRPGVSHLEKLKKLSLQSGGSVIDNMVDALNDSTGDSTNKKRQRSVAIRKDLWRELMFVVLLCLVGYVASERFLRN